jgi:hypothetical protein
MTGRTRILERELLKRDVAEECRPAGGLTTMQWFGSMLLRSQVLQC